MAGQLSNLARRDVASLFHGQTNARKLEQTGPLVITRGQGIHVYDEQGREYIDTLSSMWNVGLGYSEKRLADAAARQYETLPAFHSYYHRSHPPAIELADYLTSIAPGDMSKAFFTNSGSEAVETTVKIVRFYNNALGRTKKKKVIARKQAYHGAGIFSGSLTGLDAIHAGFDLPEEGIIRTSCPYYRAQQNNLSEEEFATSLVQEVEELIITAGPETVAAFIGEPVIGSGGVLPPPKTYWSKLQEVLRKYDVLLIVDEVITGFGRTGHMFASDLYGINPDLVILSKQITSGYAALGAVLFNDTIYQAIADQTEKLGTFGHAFTSGCHPVATAVALETLKILEERGVIAHVRAVAPTFEQRIRAFSKFQCVVDVRSVGLLGAIEVSVGGSPVGPLARQLVDSAGEHGLLLRSSGNSIVLSPPMIITKSEIDTMFDRLEACFSQVEAEV